MLSARREVAFGISASQHVALSGPDGSDGGWEGQGVHCQSLVGTLFDPTAVLRRPSLAAGSHSLRSHVLQTYVSQQPGLANSYKREAYRKVLSFRSSSSLRSVTPSTGQHLAPKSTVRQLSRILSKPRKASTPRPATSSPAVTPGSKESGISGSALSTGPLRYQRL